MKVFTTSELYDFISRADTHEKIEIAKAFISKLNYLPIDVFDDMMDALAYQSRELYWMDRSQYSPTCPWNAPGMKPSDFIR